MSKIYKSVEELIGGTPLLELVNIEKKYNLHARILAKLEYLNPAGSVKDRVAKAMIDAAERDGKLNTDFRQYGNRSCVGSDGARV